MVSPGEREKLPPSPKQPGKFAKDGKFAPQPAIRIDNRRNFKVSSNFPRFLLKCS